MHSIEKCALPREDRKVEFGGGEYGIHALIKDMRDGMNHPHVLWFEGAMEQFARLHDANELK